MYRTVIWDWNGTLLDDVSYVVNLTNRVFGQWGIAPFENVEAYRKVFDFPIREYYRRAGVGDGIFDDVANAWSRAYVEGFDCSLRPDALETAEAFNRAGLCQVIISASKESHLKEQVARYPRLARCMDGLMGLDHIYATSKVHLAQAYLTRAGIRPDEVVLIGDTRHDAQVARAIGCDCLLIAGGHQLPEVLEEAGCQVLASLTQARERILEE